MLRNAYHGKSLFWAIKLGTGTCTCTFTLTVGPDYRVEYRYSSAVMKLNIVWLITRQNGGDWVG